MRGLLEDCWICQNLHQPTHLVYYESKTSIAKLNPDQTFKGYTFLTLKQHREHLHQLPQKDQKHFLDDMAKIGTSLATALNPDRVNYELLGNTQAHLHWHIIPRYVTDPMWGRPIWAGNRPRKRLTQEAYSQLASTIRAHLPSAKRASRRSP